MARPTLITKVANHHPSSRGEPFYTPFLVTAGTYKIQGLAETDDLRTNQISSEKQYVEDNTTTGPEELQKTPGEDSDQNQRPNPALQRAIVAAQTAADNRGQDITILDMRELTPVFDYFVIANGTSRRQLHAMSEEIDHALEEGMGDRRMGIEGYDESRWILLDYGDVVINIFEPETRRYYALEELWGKAEKVSFEPKTPPA